MTGRSVMVLRAADNPADGVGPNSGPAHGGSVIFQSECQSRYTLSCLVEMIERGVAAIDVRQDVHDDYVDRVDDQAAPGDDLDPSGHDHLLPQQERPGVFRNAVAFRRLLGDRR